MAEIPPTRASLLLRLRDAQDGEAWREFVDLYAPLVYGYAQAGLAGCGCRRPVPGGVAGRRRRHRPARLRPQPRVLPQLAVHRRAPQAVELAGTAGEPGPGERGHRHPPASGPLCRAEGQEADWEAEWQRSLVVWACTQARRQVSATTWQAFWRTAIEGQPGKQVAADLGVTVAAVYHARSRMLARLKELVQSVQEP